MTEACLAEFSPAMALMIRYAPLSWVISALFLVLAVASIYLLWQTLMLHMVTRKYRR